MNVTRSFTEAEWEHVQRCVADEPAGRARTRLKCLLELLVTSGVRAGGTGPGPAGEICGSRCCRICRRRGCCP